MCDELTETGKEVYVSSLNLVRDERQYSSFRELCRRVGRIEINSPAFLGFAGDYPAVTGVFINVYNRTTADILAKRMVQRIVLPCELGFQSVASISENCQARIEVVVHGHVPIAISGNCQTARAVGTNGNGCGKVCRRHPDGILLEADGKPLFRIDGPLTLSAATYCLVEYLRRLQEVGVDTIRILPQWNLTDRIVRIYRDVLDERKDCSDALNELKTISPEGLCNGWFLGKAAWLYESSMDTRPACANIDSGFCCESPETKQDSEHGCEQCDIDTVAIDDIVRTWDDAAGLHELNQLVETLNSDPHFIKAVAEFKSTTVVLSATDTGRELMIELNKKGVRVCPYAGQAFDVKIQATEQTHWAVLTGRMDADAAFFTGKASVCGSVFTAFRVKNNFLSLLQEHLVERFRKYQAN